MSPELETEIKLALYRWIADAASVPNSAELARAMNLRDSEVREGFSRLHAKRLLVPEPGDSARIRMAPPFSAVPTPFPVEANGKRYYANCVWDAFGVAAALHTDAVVPTADGFSGEQLTLEVTNAQPMPQSYVAHFAVPAARWWDDIIYT